MTELLSTKQACEALGVTRRTLVTLWQETPTRKDPGRTGPMWWSPARLRQIAHRHGKTLTL